MPKHHLKMYLQQDGRLVIDDMSPLEISVLEKLGISSNSLNTNDQYTAVPKYVPLKNIKIPMPLPENIEDLVCLHNHIIESQHNFKSNNSVKATSLFTLKKSILKYYLKECNLCGFQCGGDRASIGLCPITRRSSFQQHFVHLGEEKEIGKTLAIELTGCNMNCRFCQKGELISQTKGIPFDGRLWKEIKTDYKVNDFNNISFLGGNPDQSIAGVLNFLSRAPKWASSWPIVWHTNAYALPALYNLLKGLVDLWIVDFKYFNDSCAVNLSGVPHYVTTAKNALKEICSNLSQDTPVIVRHLILPGHWECCQKPLINWLSTKKNEIIFNPMQQYRPLWKVKENEGDIARRITEAEYQLVVKSAQQAGLVFTELIGQSL